MNATVHQPDRLGNPKYDDRTARPVEPFPGDLPYGQDWPDSDLWQDVDGRIYAGDGGLRLRALRASNGTCGMSEPCKCGCGMTTEVLDFAETVAHEAGHLVMAAYFRFDILSVEIDPDGKSGRVKTVQGGGRQRESHLISVAGGASVLIHGFGVKAALRGTSRDHQRVRRDGVDPMPLWEEAVPILQSQKNALDFAFGLIAERRHLWGHELFGVHERIVRELAS